MKLITRISSFFLLLSFAACGWVEVPPPEGANPSVTAAPSASVQNRRAISTQPQNGERRALPASGFVRVERGDTVYGISRRYGTPVRTIIETNNLKAPFHLKAGQRLQLVKGQFHLVQPGDTLYSVSRQYRTDVYSLARANQLKSPYRLKPGQSLKLPVARTVSSKPSVNRSSVEATPRPSTLAKAPVRVAKKSIPKPPPRKSSRFSWPVQGDVILGFGAQKEGLRNDGINIAAERGTPVKAAENGVVAYSGNELRGFGNMVLIKHDGGWITAYAHTENVLVQRGQKVSKGETIARVGSSGGVVRPQLHFEIRKGMNPVNPKRFLGG